MLHFETFAQQSTPQQQPQQPTTSSKKMSPIPEASPTAGVPTPVAHRQWSPPAPVRESKHNDDDDDDLEQPVMWRRQSDRVTPDMLPSAKSMQHLPKPSAPPLSTSSRRQIVERFAPLKNVELTFSDFELQRMSRVRDDMGMAHKDLTRVWEHLRKRAVQGYLSVSTFQQAMIDLSKSTATTLNVLDARELRDVAAAFFNRFDDERTGLVDYISLVTGLAVLAGGNLQRKLSILFKIFDDDQDTFITADQLFYMVLALFRGIAAFSGEWARQQSAADRLLHENAVADEVVVQCVNDLRRAAVEPDAPLLPSSVWIRWVQANERAPFLSWITLLNDP
eukprot:TRINITY_DN65950_c9_g3_i1.p1 TRINITY_DN65950_c9_g3~~TRINITY_DN65950_c9_g3_i1.p1  ORF type:complete len:336 (+),score=191.64 TRINITY_DN65950_c9_g3_i1:838-1845(+)